MDREVLCIMDIRQIQTFLFRVNSQEAVKGGDRLVKNILTDALAWAVKAVDPPLREEQVDLSFEASDAPIPWFADPGIQVQMIDAVAGNAMLLFRTGALCQKVLHKVSRYVLEHSYGLDFAAAAAAKTDSLADDINSLYDRLDACKTDFPSSHPLPPLPAVLVEPNTGEPAVLVRGDGTPVSRSELIRTEGIRGETSLSDIHTGIGPGGRVCRAVMHLDGNNMGIMIGKAVKLAEGHLDTHSKSVVMNKDFLKEVAEAAGCSPAAAAVIDRMTLARELWSALDEEDACRFFPALRARCQQACSTVYPPAVGELTLFLVEE